MRALYTNRHIGFVGLFQETVTVQGNSVTCKDVDRSPFTM